MHARLATLAERRTAVVAGALPGGAGAGDPEVPGAPGAGVRVAVAVPVAVAVGEAVVVGEADGVGVAVGTVPVALTKTRPLIPRWRLQKNVYGWSRCSPAPNVRWTVQPVPASCRRVASSENCRLCSIAPSSWRIVSVSPGCTATVAGEKAELRATTSWSAASAAAAVAPPLPS